MMLHSGLTSSALAVLAVQASIFFSSFSSSSCFSDPVVPTELNGDYLPLMFRGFRGESRDHTDVLESAVDYIIDVATVHHRDMVTNMGIMVTDTVGSGGNGYRYANLVFVER